MISEYDRRQYNLMLEQIQAYEVKRVSLGHLASGLEYLINAVEKPDLEWKKTYGRSLAILAMAEANMVNKSVAEISIEEQKLVEEAIQILRLMVLEIVEDK